jgi:hypothetical protein
MELLRWIRSGILVASLAIGLGLTPGKKVEESPGGPGPVLQIRLVVEEDGRVSRWTGRVALEDSLGGGRPDGVEPAARDRGSDAGTRVDRWIDSVRAIVRVVEKVLEFLARDWKWTQNLPGRT